MQTSHDVQQESPSCLPTIDGKSMDAAIAERALVARGKAGDHAAFVELIRQGSPIARRVIRSIANNPADVEDVMQDTVIAAFKGLRSFNEQCKFSTWLTRIAVNNTLMLLRRRRNRTEISFDANVEDAHNRCPPLADSAVSPEQSLIQEQYIKVIRRAVRALPPILREYAELRFLAELPHSEVSATLGISLTAGKARSFRVCQRLKRSLASLRSRPA